MPRRVLLIEDEANILEALRFILERDGWTVLTHANGATALERIREARPDAVVLDVMLPGCSGFDVLRAMRADPELAAIPVLILTAKGQQRDRERAESYGASRFMAKPFANSELVAALNEMVPA